MISRAEAESILRALTGGMPPDDGDIVVFSRNYGFRFEAPSSGGLLDFFILSPGWYIAEDPLTADAWPFGYRWILCPPTVYNSIVVSYDAGGGTVNYTYDYATLEVHTLMQSDGLTPFLMGNDQTDFLITITPYTGAAGTGTAGEVIYLYTGDSMRSGRGMSLEKSDGTILTGNFFKLPPHLDADLDAADDYEPLGRLKVTYNAGSLSGNWTPDYLNSPTQRVQPNGAITLYDLSNMPDGGVMNLRFYLNSTYDLTINAGKFEGPTLSYTGVNFVALTVVSFGLSLYTVAGVPF